MALASSRRTPLRDAVFSGNGSLPAPQAGLPLTDFRPPGVTLGDMTLPDCDTGIGVIAVWIARGRQWHKLGWRSCVLSVLSQHENQDFPIS